MFPDQENFLRTDVTRASLFSCPNIMLSQMYEKCSTNKYLKYEHNNEMHISISLLFLLILNLCCVSLVKVPGNFQRTRVIFFFLWSVVTWYRRKSLALVSKILRSNWKLANLSGQQWTIISHLWISVSSFIKYNSPSFIKFS